MRFQVLAIAMCHEGLTLVSEGLVAAEELSDAFGFDDHECIGVWSYFGEGGEIEEASGLVVRPGTELGDLGSDSCFHHFGSFRNLGAKVIKRFGICKS